MNKAIFLYTFLRHTRLSTLLALGAYVVLLPIGFTMICLTEDITATVLPMLFGPALAMVIAYSFVQYTVANNRSINDGEYLALIFSRPITRASYVVTKWLAGTVAVAAVTLIQLGIFLVTIQITGRTTAGVITPFFIADMLLNAAAYSALVVLICVFPMRLGMVFFISVFYFALLGSMIPALVERTASGGTSFLMANFFSTGFQVLRAIVTPSVDTYQIFNNVSFSILPIVNYVSNICIYLALSIFVLTQREFFYAAE